MRVFVNIMMFAAAFAVFAQGGEATLFSGLFVSFLLLHEAFEVV